MFGPQKPFVDLTIGGSPAGFFIGGALKEFTYSDVHHGAVDEIHFRLADGSGLWRSSWGIDEGTEVSAVLGYQGLLGGSIPCGTYAVDEPESQGDGTGDTATFKALAAFTSKDLRTDRSEGYDKTTLKAIIGHIAARHKLRHVGEIPELSFERITQDKESDLAFLTRLAEDWGCYFSVKGAQLVFTTRESVEDAPAVRTFNLTAGDRSIRYTLRKSTKGLYAKAEMAYLHPKTKAVVKAVALDARVPSGDTLKIDDRGETQAHADRMVKAKLALANDGLGTGKLTLVGDPLMVAGQVVEMGLSFGRYAGRWLVVDAAHKLTSTGYTTTINVKAL